MTPKLNQELRQALAQQSGLPLTVEDPDTHTRYVLISLDTFERMQQLLPHDDSDPDPRQVSLVVDQVMAEDDANDPTLQRYQITDDAQ